MMNFKDCSYECKNCRIDILNGVNILEIEELNIIPNWSILNFYTRQNNLFPFSHRVFERDTVLCRGCGVVIGQISLKDEYREYFRNTGIYTFQIWARKLLFFMRSVSVYFNFSRFQLHNNYF